MAGICGSSISGKNAPTSRDPVFIANLDQRKNARDKSKDGFNCLKFLIKVITWNVQKKKNDDCFNDCQFYVGEEMRKLIVFHFRDIMTSDQYLNNSKTTLKSEHNTYVNIKIELLSEVNVFK